MHKVCNPDSRPIGRKVTEVEGVALSRSWQETGPVAADCVDELLLGCPWRARFAPNCHSRHCSRGVF